MYQLSKLKIIFQVNETSFFTIFVLDWETRIKLTFRGALVRNASRHYICGCWETEQHSEDRVRASDLKFTLHCFCSWVGVCPAVQVASSGHALKRSEAKEEKDNHCTIQEHEAPQTEQFVEIVYKVLGSLNGLQAVHVCLSARGNWAKDLNREQLFLIYRGGLFFQVSKRHPCSQSAKRGNESIFRFTGILLGFRNEAS